jgi:hypothetical protein
MHPELILLMSSTRVVFMGAACHKEN